MPGRSHWWLLIVFVLAPGTMQHGLRAQVSPVTIQDVTPRAVTPGQRTVVTFRGKSLATAKSLWLSTSAKVERVSASDDKAVFAVTTDSRDPGRMAARVVATAGVSNARLLLADDLPTPSPDNLRTVNKRTPRPGSHVVLQGPSGVDGAVEPARADLYLVTLAKGQRLTVEAWARRLGSSLDPVLSVVGPDGRSLTSVDDSPGLDGDAVLSIETATPGLHSIAISDVSRGGGASHFYRLRVGHFQPVQLVFPPVVMHGREQQVTLLGDGVSAVRKLPASTPVGTRWLGGSAAPGAGLAMARVEVQKQAVLLETEPNDSRELAKPLVLARRIYGRFQAEGDRDWYAVTLKKNVKFEVMGDTASLGAAGRLYMQLVDESGEILVESTPTVSTRTTLTYMTGLDRKAFLVVEELQQRGGPSFAYELEGRGAQRGFELNAGLDRLHGKIGSAVQLKVTATRRDFDGAIELSVDGLSKGVKVTGNRIERGKNETTLSMTWPEGTPTDKLLSLRIVGSGLLEPPTEGMTVFERASVKYDRGDLGKYDGFISDNKGGLNYAEYDVEIPEAGKYLVLLRYAALSTRVATLKLNGKVASGQIMTQTTGSWEIKTARWFNEGLVEFPRGKSVLRLEKTGVFSHLTTVRVARPLPRTKEPAKSVTAQASTVGAVRGSLGGMTHVPATLDGPLILSLEAAR